jgi:hypothetical protein
MTCRRAADLRGKLTITWLGILTRSHKRPTKYSWLRFQVRPPNSKRLRNRFPKAFELSNPCGKPRPRRACPAGALFNNQSGDAINFARHRPARPGGAMFWAIGKDYPTLLRRGKPAGGKYQTCAASGCQTSLRRGKLGGGGRAVAAKSGRLEAYPTFYNPRLYFVGGPLHQRWLPNIVPPGRARVVTSE